MKRDQSDVSTSIKVLAGIVTAICAIAAPFVAVGGYKVRIETLEKNAQASDSQKVHQWTAINAARDVTNRHDVMIPAIKEDVQDLKADIKVLRAEQSAGQQRILEEVRKLKR